MQNPHGVENAVSSGEEGQRTTGEETRNSKRLKTKHTNKKNSTSSGGNNDNNEIEHTKNPKDKNTRSRSDNPSEHLENSREKNVNGGGNSGNEDNDGGKKKQEALGNMEKIEKEFTDLKEKFFKDKIGQLKKEVDAIRNGTHPQFCEQCKDLDDAKNEKIVAAEQWRQYQLQSINNMFEAERQQAEEECTTEKRLLKDRLINTILDKKKKITEDKMTMNITDPTDTRTTNTRQLRRRGGAPPPPPTTQVKKKLAPPSINYTLKDSEIQEDLNAIFNKRETRTR